MLKVAETVVRTDPGRQRRGNEDAAWAQAPMFVLADGMGGAQAGEVASAIVADTFEGGTPDSGTPEERLSVLVQRANREIYDRSHADADTAGMGTTVTAAYFDADAVSLAHVGDSRGYLYRQGELVMLTSDHSLVGELLREGKLTDQEAFEHPQRSIITRALGQEPVVEIDTWTYPLKPGDVVLLCSDGLTDMITEPQVQATLAQAPNLGAAADNLIAAANAAGGRDNITVVLFRVEDANVATGEQPTQVGMPPVAAAPPSRGATSGPTPAPRPKARATKAPLARLQGWTAQMPEGFTQPAPKRRHFGRLGKFVAFMAALAVVLLLVGGGGYLASRQLYFLGTNKQGTVVVYRGFPYTLPFGVPMYETFYVSGVPAASIPEQYRKTLLNHSIRNQTNAVHTINQLELGNIAH
jgi:PPM family protein phosphatase